MKLVIKYKDYESHIRTRLFMGESEPTHIGSLIMRAEEFKAFQKALEKSDLDLTLIEIHDRFQVTEKGPDDDASRGIKES